MTTTKIVLAECVDRWDVRSENASGFAEQVRDYRLIKMSEAREYAGTCAHVLGLATYTVQTFTTLPYVFRYEVYTATDDTLVNRSYQNVSCNPEKDIAPDVILNLLSIATHAYYANDNEKEVDALSQLETIGIVLWSETSGYGLSRHDVTYFQ